MDTLLDLKQAEIILMMDDEEENNACCNELIEKWTPQLENETGQIFHPRQKLYLLSPDF